MYFIHLICLIDFYLKCFVHNFIIFKNDYFFFGIEKYINYGFTFNFLSKINYLYLCLIQLFVLIILYFNFNDYYIKIIIIAGYYNLFDRFYHKHIIDYIKINNVIFNLADVIICYSLLSMILPKLYK